MNRDLDALAARWGHAYLLGYAQDQWIAIRRDSLRFIPADTLAQLEAEIQRPVEQWHWSAAPTHPAIVDRATGDRAQQVGAEHANPGRS